MKKENASQAVNNRPFGTASNYNAVRAKQMDIKRKDQRLHGILFAAGGAIISLIGAYRLYRVRRMN